MTDMDRDEFVAQRSRRAMTDIVEWLRNSTSAEWNGPMLNKAADEIERRTAEHDDYVIRANANVCEINREIERLRAHIDTLVQERDAERQTYNDAIARHLSEIKRLKAQLARTETALDNEFNNGIALCAEIERLKMEAKVMK